MGISTPWRKIGSLYRIEEDFIVSKLSSIGGSIAHPHQFLEKQVGSGHISALY
ncbi:hypothetical protein MTR_8g065620 [Medicago truncatula]|uniref:Uncharacterized protein n=1 Tax=Medicago truncatula TaxID=3880 RepID=G7LG63_MEDTR|nr:hypothetical protein MTR_8g065620 [Medicago truncatula]